MNWNDEPRAPRPGTPGGVPPQRPDRAAPRRVPPSPGPRHEPRHARGSVPPPAAGPSPDPGRGPEGGVRVEPRADRPGRIDETRYRQRHSGETDAVDSRASRNAGDEEASPTGLARDSDSSILRTSGSIAIATLFSRITGFLRTVLILAMLGSGIASAFQAADVLPNMIAEVVLGAVLTAIVIPLLARAEAEDPDGGQGFINRIFTITVVVLGTATVFAVIAAPALTYMNLGDGQVNRDLSTHLAYLLLPEILFYGLSALFIAILNVRGLFKPGAWAPVLNNVVQITTLVLYALVPGEITLNPVRMSDPQLLVLGVGCTLGVVLQAMVLVPFLKKAGVHLRLEWGIDARLRQFGNMAVAIVAYVALLQVGLVATYRIASSAEASGVSIYFTHWQLLQLPYGVLGVTILTAIMPRLSRNAAADNAKAVVDDLSLATRLTMVALVPVVSFMTFFGPAIAIAVFNFGRFEAADANQLGSVLAWGAFTLIPYSMTLVQLRVFYAREDAWTPTFIALGITVVKVGSSYLGPVLFDNPSNVVRWLALSNGLGYLVGAIVGHFLLRSRLGGARMTNVVRTTLVTFAVSIGVSATVWFVAKTTGLDGMIGWAGKLGSLIYLALTAAVVLAVTYAGLAAAQVPDVVAIGNSVRRVLGRFIPALAPPPEPERDQSPAITVAFPRVSADESLPYSGQVQVLRRFDRGTATWQSYSVHTGGAIGAGRGPRPIPPRAPVPRDIRYRRKGVRRVSDSELDTTAAVGSPADSGPGSTSGHSPTDVQTPENPVHANPATEATGAPTPPVPPRRVRPRGPRLVPGAVVAGGRYRLLERHGGSRGLQFWRALDINLDREVALTFVDAEQLAPPPEPGQEIRPTDQGPQAVLTRTLRLGQITHDGVARVLDVVRGSSGGIVVAEWVPGSSLAEVARTKPSPIGAARAVRSLAAAAEIAHRSGGALSIDHPDRIRISHDGNAVLAFPGTLAGHDKASDVRGLGAVLYALLLNRWTLDPETGSRLITTDDVTEPVGGIPVAEPGDDGRPREPRAVDPEIPFEISAVAARALDGTRGIRTAATVQHVLDQATVVDLNTDMLPAITDADAAPPVSVTPRIGSNEGSPKRRNTALLIGAGLLAIFVVIALIVGATNVFGGDEGSSDIDSIIPTSEPAPAGQPAPGADAPTAGPTQEIPLQAVSVLDFSAQTPDNPANVANVISGQVPVWQTDNYRGRPDFGGLKQGLGLMFDLGAERPVKSVTIDSPTPGFDVEIRTSPSATPAFARTTPVAAARVDSDSKTIELAEPATSRYVMVWITSLPESPNGGYQAQISKVTMEG
ncbi:murein biosynthesis integral membrane protein MurJ [Gordonia paraffinivorans]|uniref:murein biosynthesis integral membrane protein MurJ n=1 Tax=Gordonia paraffinivorans TaxID=175628 RepID=UPI001444EC57|nr:murein biosynthesis integral membrane protein MurJ [Gordonia paraffinivorans]MCD2145836.1 virulence factor MviN [Gordonia paraffinivorans]